MVPPSLEERIKETILAWENLTWDYDTELMKTSNERLNAIDEPLLSRVSGKVLEVGCGTGRLAKPVEALGGEYTGIDPSVKLLKQAFNKGVISLVRGVGEYLPFPDNYFDTIIGGYHSFRYIFLDKAYSECARVLKPGGILAFTLWNYWSLCLHTVSANVRTFKTPWSDLPPFPTSKTGEACNDLVWFYGEKKRLQKTGLKVVSVLSTRRFPLLNRYMSWRGYWHGSIGSLIGYDVIITCKNGKASTERNHDFKVNQREF
jgi:SAM-dependent methyltransferase